MTKKHIVTLAAIWCLSLGAIAQQHSFTLGENDFLLDGKPFQVISGEMHYPRVPREAWRSRMKMAKAMGLNTIGTYIFWNLHEPQKDVFDFSGANDIAAFVKTAQEEGLWVILRPSPYVCAEWEFGGYPYWLQNEAGLEVRSKEARYLEEYRKYINAVGKQLAAYQVNHGGNILMVQIENEYGSYGSDKDYLEINRKMFVDAGFDGLLYTCDPASDVAKGHLPGLLPAINGVDKPAQIRKIIGDNHNGKGPYFVAEWYPAWFDWWGTKHHTVPAEKYLPGLDSVLSNGMSINMYMFHGGTTRGFMNGANYKDNTPYEPQISSYDYDAPLDEAGNATPKFMAFRSVIQKHLPAGQTLPDVPAAKPAITIPPIVFTQDAYVKLPVAVRSATPLSFEALLQPYGYVLYKTVMPEAGSGKLKIEGLRDYAIVYLDGKKVGVLDRRLKQDDLSITIPVKGTVLEIWVENMGRINFGKYLLQNKKGLTGKVTFKGNELQEWEMFGFPFSDIKKLSLEKAPQTGALPRIKQATFQLQAVGDTYLDMQAWGKGVVWINGHNLGRYWSIGPQQTLYVPAEWLKKGKNQITILELLKPEANTVSGLSSPILSKLQ